MANILVVDDEEQVRRLLNRTLSGTEYTCTLAADGAEARKCLAKQPFDLALCDVNMPGESGLIWPGISRQSMWTLRSSY